MNFSPWINEEFSSARLSPHVLDELWGSGWRRFGSTWFRYSITVSDSGTLDVIVPLRIPVKAFSPSKSQRRVLRSNADVTWEIKPLSDDPALKDLFEKHKGRFKSNIPESLACFLGDSPGDSPCECLEFRCLLDGRLIAVSFLDVGQESVSSIYAIFDPAESQGSPGILTMLKEIEWARENGRSFHHPGYTTLSPGVYEYKKQFRPLEGYDWTSSSWVPWTDMEDSLNDVK